jgi:hypothetical protein
MKKYRIEWLHNGNWRMELNHKGEYDSKQAAERAARSNDYGGLKTRIVEIELPQYERMPHFLIVKLDGISHQVNFNGYDGFTKKMKKAVQEQYPHLFVRGTMNYSEKEGL